VKEMSDQVRGLVFVAVALLIIVIWSHFYKPPEPPPQQKPAPTAQQAPVTSNVPSTPASAPAPASTPVVKATEEKIIVVESPLYTVELSNHGGVVRSWKLKKYLDDQKPPRPLDLVYPDVAQQFGWPFSLLLSDSQVEEQANSGLYKFEITGLRGGPPAPDQARFDAPATVTFHYSDGHLGVTKQLKFDSNYEISIETSVALEGKPLPSAIAWRGGFGDRAVYQAAQLVSVFYKQGGKLNVMQYKKLGVDKNQAQQKLQPGPMEFLGIEDQFFTASFLPDGTDLSLWDWVQQRNTGTAEKPESQPVAEMAAGTTNPTPLKMRAYIGPKDLALLSKVQPSLEELVQFGWFSFIAKPLLFVLQWIHRYIPNYGWAIVVFTLVLTMAMLPIRIWTFHSARKMQLVAPEVKSIQDRYKKYSMSDPRKRKMQEEIMAVYNREGVNPMGSCLPMLVQIPILFAFYRMLAGAIELRHAPWFGWIHDLSAKDPYYILPILMVITTYLMTKMTPTPATTDPAQQKMMMLMPLFMGFIFFNLSSGLNLYYFASNLIGVVQQWYLNRAEPLPSRSKFKNKKE
jgi:YidC/Oxa1 family membrane protein insertase